mmetsp:Transcript_45222/g.71504  ORF Transcript_45222/g.71504 Transcript_45222/m.71504 type:complete len:168 (+) Transcript_45222:1103-1606(+)
MCDGSLPLASACVLQPRCLGRFVGCSRVMVGVTVASRLLRIESNCCETSCVKEQNAKKRAELPWGATRALALLLLVLAPPLAVAGAPVVVPAMGLVLIVSSAGYSVRHRGADREAAAVLSRRLRHQDQDSEALAEPALRRALLDRREHIQIHASLLADDWLAFRTIF